MFLLFWTGCRHLGLRLLRLPSLFGSKIQANSRLKGDSLPSSRLLNCSLFLVFRRTSIALVPPRSRTRAGDRPVILFLDVYYLVNVIVFLRLKLRFKRWRIGLRHDSIIILLCSVVFVGFVGVRF